MKKSNAKTVTSTRYIVIHSGLLSKVDWGSQNNTIVWWLYRLHLSHWTRNKGYHRYLDLHLKIDTERPVNNETLWQNERWFQFSNCGLSIYIATFQQHMHMEYIALSWYDIPEHMVPIRISLIGFLLSRKPLNQGFLVVKLEVIITKVLLSPSWLC